MSYGTAVSLYRLFLQYGVDNLTPFVSHLKLLYSGCSGLAIIFFVEAVADLLWTLECVSRILEYCFPMSLVARFSMRVSFRSRVVPHLLYLEPTM